MDLRFKTNLLEHTKAVAAWARQRGAQTSIDVADMSLTVKLNSGPGTSSDTSSDTSPGTSAPPFQHRLHAQFVGKRDGKHLCYFDVADPFAIGFVGWLPYKAQAWDISLSKLTFKSAAREVGIATPAYWTQPEFVDTPFLVKRARGAFGDGMRGPYKPDQAAQFTLADGEFFEAFKWGHIARAWYWGERLAVLELFAMPTVTGDGRSSYEALLRQGLALGVGAADLPTDFADIARLQNVRPFDVPQAGASIVCDYRYVSPFNPTVYANHNVLQRIKTHQIVQHFADAGRRMLPRVVSAAADSVSAASPNSDSTQIGFVLDAIVDAQGQPWFLEINSNAQLHPDLYAAMLDGVCGLTSTRSS
jgi:hypothetical protein